MILDKDGLLLPAFLPDNSVCYTTEQPTHGQPAPGWIEPDRKQYIIMSVQELVNVALSKLPEIYKRFAKDCIGVADHRATLKVSLPELSPELLQTIYSDCFTSVITDAAANTIQFDVWLKDFHTNQNIKVDKK